MAKFSDVEALVVEVEQKRAEIAAAVSYVWLGNGYALEMSREGCVVLRDGHLPLNLPPDSNPAMLPAVIAGYQQYLAWVAGAVDELPAPVPRPEGE